MKCLCKEKIKRVVHKIHFLVRTASTVKESIVKESPVII